METFNVNFSLVKFLKSVAATFNLSVFLNKKPTAAEEQLMGTLDRYLVIQTNNLDTNVLQPISVKLALHATPTADPTGLWLDDIPQQFNKICIQRKTHPNPALRLIAIYDFDTVVGSTALTTFQQTGTIPATLLTALNLEYPTLTLWEPLNQAVGLQCLTTESPQSIDMSDVPYKVIWRVIFRYFSPESMMGAYPSL